MKRLLILPLVIFLAGACAKKEHSGIYDQGKIEYKITYLNEDNGNFDPSLLPKKMILEFNKDFCTNTIDGFMGFFRLGNLTYFGKKKSTTYLKVIDKSYIFYGNKQELMCCFDAFEGMKIEPDTVTKTIAGLKSNLSRAIVPSTGDTFDIFYTYDINLDNPNITNPYLNINGVLTDFVLYMGPYKMRFEAQKFDPTKSPKEDMGVSENAVKVSRQEMVYALERLMQ
ncbi:MAG: hypothetical protein JXB34_10215 [Bacteroidales bacterium]|nr:hypothetical protein [Bacteroidales bacterium]